MRRLRVAIDATPVLGAKTGIGHYIANLIQALQVLDGAPDLAYFLGSSWVDHLPLSNASLAKRPLPVRGISRTLDLFGKNAALLKKNLNLWYRQRKFLGGIRLIAPDVIHNTNYSVFDADVPSVVNVYDISCFRHPETHPAARVEMQKQTLPKALQTACHILTISEFSKNEIVDYFGISPSRISVTHVGVDSDFRPRDMEEIAPVLARYSLDPGNYILTVGTIEPRKNLETLVQAFQRLPSSIRTKFPLVIVGMRGWKESKFMRLLDPLISQGSVKLLGYVEQGDLPLIYAGARVFAFPSLYEGFGMPPLEALASGIPVVVSDRSALPEVVGDAALVVDALNPVVWAESIQRLLEDQTLYHELAIAGPERARRFSWKGVAEITLAAYREAADS